MTFPTNRGKTFPAEPLTAEEVHRLLAASSTRSSSGIRLRALIGVMYGAGLRISEALALRPKDVDTQDCTVRVLDGKGGKSRVVGIDPRSCALLEAWLERRRSLSLNGRHPIFATYETGKVGRPLSGVYVRRALARLGERAGIDKRVHPHGLRHSLAFDLAQWGVPTHVIQAQLGHASLAVTDRYVRHPHARRRDRRHAEPRLVTHRVASRSSSGPGEVSCGSCRGRKLGEGVRGE